MREKLEIATYGPHPIEVYAACVALHQPVPRREVKRLQRERLLTSKQELSEDGNALLGRLRWLRKNGKVAEKPREAGMRNQTINPPGPSRNYPGRGSRRQRMAMKKAMRNYRPPAAVPAPTAEPKPKVFESAYA